MYVCSEWIEHACMCWGLVCAGACGVLSESDNLQWIISSSALRAIRNKGPEHTGPALREAMLKCIEEEAPVSAGHDCRMSSSQVVMH